MDAISSLTASLWVTPWEVFVPDTGPALPEGWQVWQARGLNPNNSDPPQSWQYLCVRVDSDHLDTQRQVSWYLYARAEPLAQVYILGVFVMTQRNLHTQAANC